MATPKKTAVGTWRIQISVRGVRDSETLPTRREALEWAARRTTELRAQAAGTAGSIHTVDEAVDRYIKTEAVKRRGALFEVKRLSALRKMPHFPAKKKMGDVTSTDISAWRDARLAQVSPGTVKRELTLIAQLFEVARREWRWCSANPVRDVRKPPEPRHRDRIITGVEVRKMLRVLDWRCPVDNSKHALACFFVAALQTGMRAGELCALRWEDVRADHCVLHTSKTGHGRLVPLTPPARRNIERMRGYSDDGTVFGLRADIRDALWRKYRAKAGLSGFTFHDARHTAATRMKDLVDVLDLCKILGWTDPKRAMVYYNPSVSDLAAKLTA